MVDSSCKYFFKVIVAQAGSACKESRPFLRKKRTACRSAVLLGEGIFTMGYSKNYI